MSVRMRRTRLVNVALKMELLPRCWARLENKSQLCCLTSLREAAVVTPAEADLLYFWDKSRGGI